MSGTILNNLIRNKKKRVARGVNPAEGYEEYEIDLIQ